MGLFDDIIRKEERAFIEKNRDIYLANRMRDRLVDLFVQECEKHLPEFAKYFEITSTPSKNRSLTLEIQVKHEDRVSDYFISLRTVSPKFEIYSYIEGETIDIPITFSQSDRVLITQIRNALRRLFKDAYHDYLNSLEDVADRLKNA